MCWAGGLTANISWLPRSSPSALAESIADKQGRKKAVMHDSPSSKQSHIPARQPPSGPAIADEDELPRMSPVGAILCAAFFGGLVVAYYSERVAKTGDLKRLWVNANI